MTLILALPAADGFALASDTRKRFRTGRSVDGHTKLVAGRDGLVTGAGSGQLLDQVAGLAGDRSYPELIDLITRVAQPGIWDFEQADWTLTVEGSSGCTCHGEGGVGMTVFDGFSFKRSRWPTGSLPAGLPAEFVERASLQVEPVLAGRLSLSELRTIAFDVFSEIYGSGLISQDFHFGTHRPGKRLSIERLRVAGPVQPVAKAHAEVEVTFQ